MESLRKRLLIFLLPLCLLLAISGCAHPTYRAHPEFELRIKNITSAQLAPPDVKIYEVTAGGIKDLRDDWCSKAVENIQKSLKEAFKENRRELKIIPIDKDLESEWEEILALYKAVNASILWHTYNEKSLFLEKRKYFDYSLGPIDKILRKYNADALIIVWGTDEISTSGRKALAVAGIAVGIFTGIPVVPRSGVAAISIALVDSTGTVIWYSIRGSQGGYDLRDYESCAQLVKDILSDFPNLQK